MAGTVLGTTLVVDGELTGADPVIVRGTFRGRLNVRAAVVIDLDATVEADVHGSDVEVDGAVTGNVEADDRVEVHAHGKVVGDIRAPRIHIADGATFKGNVDVVIPVVAHAEGLHG